MDSILGIDIGSSYTKIVEIMVDGSKYSLNKFALFPSKTLLHDFSNPKSHGQKGSIDYFNGIITEAGFVAKKVHIALPEHRILTKVLSLPYIEGDKNIKQPVEFEATKHLPLNLAETTLKYTVLVDNNSDKKPKPHQDILGKKTPSTENTNEKMDVLLVAAPTILIESFVAVFDHMGLIIEKMEPTSIATTRVALTDSHAPTILIQFGNEYVDFVLILSESVRFVRSIKLGVYTLVRALSQEMGLSQIQAENYLFTYGLNPSQQEGKVRHILEPAVGVFVQELDRFLKYVEARVVVANNNDSSKVKRIVLSGGGALIPNFIIYLIEKSGFEVVYADPWIKVDINNIPEKDMLKLLSPLFTTAVGIVLK